MTTTDPDPDPVLDMTLEPFEPSMRLFPHESSILCGDVHCFIHDVDESAIGGYQICTECGHVYRSKAELEREYTKTMLMNAEILRMFMDPPPELKQPDSSLPAIEITFCPLCVADFI